MLKLLNRAREKLVRLAKIHGVDLRQSYARLGKFAMIRHRCDAHAKQFKRANRMLKKLRTLLGRVVRDTSAARSTVTAGSKGRSPRRDADHQIDSRTRNDGQPPFSRSF